MERAGVRDFIYLDIERVRSFVAQVSHGLPEGRTSLSQHQVGGEGQAKGKIPLFAETTGSVDYHYLKSQSETKSLHDHIFEEMYSYLTSDESFKDLFYMKDPDWTETFFKDGSFVKARGLLKIVDYQSLKLDIDTLPKLLSTIIKLISAGNTANSQANTSAASSKHGSAQRGTVQAKSAPLSKAQGASSIQITPQGSGVDLQELMQQKKILEAFPLKDTADLINQLYGDVIRVKIFPFFENSADRVFIGTAERPFFRYQPRMLSTWYGPIVDAEWISILQINRGRSYDLGQFASSAAGNKFENVFEEFADRLSGLGTLTQGVTFPAIAVTPIAIYREQ